MVKRIKYFLFFVAIFIDIMIWPIGIWLMLVPEYDPNTVGRAMASVILLTAIPLFMFGPE